MADNARNEDAQAQDGSEKTTSTPPWGDKENFDEERAWRLIQNLRAERDEARQERDELKAEKAAAEDAKKTEAEKAAEAARKAQERAEKAERDLYVERAMRRHEIPEDLAEFVSGKSEEEINERAERLAKRIKGEKPDSKKEKDADDGRPAPALTPGHGGDAPEPFDAHAIALAAREAL